MTLNAKSIGMSSVQSERDDALCKVNSDYAPRKINRHDTLCKPNRDVALWKTCKCEARFQKQKRTTLAQRNHADNDITRTLGKK